MDWVKLNGTESKRIKMDQKSKTERALKFTIDLWDSVLQDVIETIA